MFMEILCLGIGIGSFVLFLRRDFYLVVYNLVTAVWYSFCSSSRDHLSQESHAKRMVDPDDILSPREAGMLAQSCHAAENKPSRGPHLLTLVNGKLAEWPRSSSQGYQESQVTDVVPVTLTDLPDNVLWRIFDNLQPQERVMFSRTCRKLRRAAEEVPRDSMPPIVLTLDNVNGGGYGLLAVSAEKLLDLRKDFLENRKTHLEEHTMDEEELRENGALSCRFDTMFQLSVAVKELLLFGSLDEFRICTTLSDLLTEDWFRVCRMITRNKHVAFPLMFDLSSDRRRHEFLLCLPEALLSPYNIVCQVSFLFVLWNFARTGIRSLVTDYYWPLSVFPTIKMEWFSFLSLDFVSLSHEVNEKALTEFDKFVRKFLDGGCRDSSFCFSFMVQGGTALKKKLNPFEAQLSTIRRELKQSKSVCYHEEYSGVRSCWHTINKGQHRLMWQGPIVAEEYDAFFMRVKGVRDPDDLIPRTRPVTKSLNDQMERSCRYTLTM